MRFSGCVAAISVFLLLASCASKPLVPPPLPDAELLSAHIGLTEDRDRVTEIHPYYSRDISDDVAILAFNFAIKSFSEVSRITEIYPPPAEIDLLLEIVDVITAETKGWSDFTTTISVTWLLTERDGVPVWSHKSSGTATSKGIHLVSKWDERIAVALQQILADSITAMQDAVVRGRAHAALERVDAKRQKEVSLLAAREEKGQDLLASYKVGELAIKEFRNDWDFTYSTELGIVGLEASGGNITYYLGVSPLETIIRIPSVSGNIMYIIEAGDEAAEKQAMSGENVRSVQADAVFICELTFRERILSDNGC